MTKMTKKMERCETRRGKENGCHEKKTVGYIIENERKTNRFGETKEKKLTLFRMITGY